jgi:mRNA interferase MazF
LGLAAKVRPVLVVSVPFSESDFALVEVVPHTTQSRGAQFEVTSNVPFLAPGVFNVQGMLAVPAAKFLRRLGVMSGGEMARVEAMMKHWLGLSG